MNNCIFNTYSLMSIVMTPPKKTLCLLEESANVAENQVSIYLLGFFPMEL